MTLPPGRELSDSALLEQLGGFAQFRARGGNLSLAEWMDARDFTAHEKTLLEVTWMGLTIVSEDRA